MALIYNNKDELFNKLLKINQENPYYLNNKKDSIPISNKYYLSILDDNNILIKNFFDYINDNERIKQYPFQKDLSIDYSFILEEEQFYRINLKESNLNELSNNLDQFYKIILDSNAEVSFIIDIEYLLNFIMESKLNLIPNHLLDFLLWKLEKYKINNLLILDEKNICKNNLNMLYYQLEACLKNFNNSKYNLDKTISVYRKIEDSVIETVYWNMFYPEFKITKYIKKIISPISDDEFDLVQINNKESFYLKLKILDIIDKNLFELHLNHGIVIDPSERLNILL